jgi:hypothetical protein
VRSAAQEVLKRRPLVLAAAEQVHGRYDDSLFHETAGIGGHGARAGSADLGVVGPAGDVGDADWRAGRGVEKTG